MAGSFQIPHVLDGNIKQRLIPFVINPKMDINSSEVSQSSNKGYPQLFTFRSNDYFKSAPAKADRARLQLYPSSFEKYFSKDISYKMLYQRDYKKEKVTLNYLLDSIPGIQIREYLPDIKLDQVITFINEILDALVNGSKGIFDSKNLGDAVKDDAKSISKIFAALQKRYTENPADKIITDLTWLIKYVFSVTEDNKSLISDVLKSGNADDGMKFDQFSDKGDYQKMKNFVFRLPYLLYYRLQSCTTTNIYELPYTDWGSPLYSSNGGPGWEGVNAFGIKSALSLIGSILPPVNIQMAPFYNAYAGENTPEDGITISFDLFNDNAKAAMNNFIFVNTIIPQNRWLQYGLLQQSPCLYDIRIDGVKRLYLCTGSFKVTYPQGCVLRAPPQKWMYDLFKTHGNRCINNIYADFEIAIEREHIRIPDVYHVELQFKSLMPANFNTFLFQYAENQNNLTIYSKKARDESNLVSIVKDAPKNIAESLSSHFK